MIVSFQACGPKNYQFRKTQVDKEGKVSTVSKVKHKGISMKTEVTEEDYSGLIMLWDKQYDAVRSVMAYDPHNRTDAFKSVRVEMVDEPIKSKKNLALPKPRTKKVKRLLNVQDITKQNFSRPTVSIRLRLVYL